MSRISSYSSIFALGHRMLGHDFMDGSVVVEEKLDGSQFSFSLGLDGELSVRSKGKEMVVDAPEKMFIPAVNTALELATDLVPGWVYRGEYLQKPKHNTIPYDRVPAKHVILFDIDRGGQDYLDPDEKRTEAGRLGLEVVPTFFEGRVESLEDLVAMLSQPSCLGGATPEGFVLKRYDKFGEDKKVLMAKYVTEAFKEDHRANWKADNPTNKDIIVRLIETYRTPARWRKAVEHLRDAGELEGSPRDIGKLMKEVSVDILKECEADIKDKLFEHAWKHLSRGITNGIPQWYKDELAKHAFDGTYSDTAEIEGHGSLAV